VPGVEDIRARRPREVVVARLLSIIAVVLWVPIAGYVYYYQPALVTLSLILFVFGAFGAAKGRKAGRILFVVMLALTYWFVLPYCVVGFGDPSPEGPVFAAMDICAVLLAATAIVLVYRPRSNRYFHLVEAARRGAGTTAGDEDQP
jgi:hypothetical protein